MKQNKCINIHTITYNNNIYGYLQFFILATPQGDRFINKFGKMVDEWYTCIKYMHTLVNIWFSTGFVTFICASCCCCCCCCSRRRASCCCCLCLSSSCCLSASCSLLFCSSCCCLANAAASSSILFSSSRRF